MRRIALVGDRSAAVRAHARIPTILDGLRERDGLDLDAYWVPTADVTGPDAVAGFDGIWVVPGSPYQSQDGAIAAVRAARENNIPFLGTCGGFQHAMLEYARNVCGLTTAGHAEYSPELEDALIVPLSCSLVGHEAPINVEPGSMAQKLLGAARSIERYHCSYGLAGSYLDVLRDHGMRFTGVDDDGEVRIAELVGHPFWLATLFQPELAGDGGQAHPLIRGFAAAVTGASFRPPAGAPSFPPPAGAHRWAAASSTGGA
jgi:CTP synthase (UTP-ammonia lyase)